MKQKGSTPALAALILLLAAAVAGAGLRTAQLSFVFDAEGLPASGHPLTWVLSIFCILIFLLTALFCLRLPQRKTAQAVLRPDLFSEIITSAGGLLLCAACLLEAADSLLTLHTSSQQLLNALDLLLCVAGILSGFLIFAAAMARHKGHRSSIWLYVIPFLYLMCRLVLDFKNWSADPIILDYCFMLFASICVMCGSYRIGGFCFDLGKRRLSTFWAMTGVFFSAAAIPGSSMAEACFYCAAFLWMLGYVHLLLWPGRDPDPVTEPESETEESA